MGWQDVPFSSSPTANSRSLTAFVEGCAAVEGDAQPAVNLRNGHVDLRSGAVISGEWIFFYKEMATGVHEAVHGGCWWAIGKGTQGATTTLKAIKDHYYQHFSDMSLNTLQNSTSG